MKYLVPIVEYYSAQFQAPTLTLSLKPLFLRKRFMNGFLQYANNMIQRNTKAV